MDRSIAERRQGTQRRIYPFDKKERRQLTLDKAALYTHVLVKLDGTTRTILSNTTQALQVRC